MKTFANIILSFLCLSINTGVLLGLDPLDPYVVECVVISGVCLVAYGIVMFV